MYVNPIAAFEVTLDGQDLTSKIRPRLVSMTLTEQRGTESDQLDIVIADSDGRMALPSAGAVLSLRLGWAQGTGVAVGMVDKGQFRVDEVEHSGAPDVLTLRARAVDFTATARIRNLRSWRDTTLGAVIADLAAHSGLQSQVDGSLGSKPVAVLAQGRMSDMALLQQLGRKYDAVATVKAGRLLFAPIGKGVSAGGKALPSASIARADGDQHSYRRAARDTYSGATAYWHDPNRAERVGVTVGSTTNAKRLRRTYGSEADARAAAEAEHGRDTRSAATFGLTLALAQPTLYPEQKVSVSGFKGEIDAIKWLIVRSTHSIGDQGFTTIIELEQAV